MAIQKTAISQARSNWARMDAGSHFIVMTFDGSHQEFEVIESKISTQRGRQSDSKPNYEGGTKHNVRNVKTGETYCANCDVFAFFPSTRYIYFCC
jgi:hypothetical protein